MMMRSRKQPKKKQPRSSNLSPLSTTDHQSIKSGSNNSSPSADNTPFADKTSRPIWWGRWFFFVLLFCVATALGFMIYMLLRDNEDFLAECVFKKVAERAIKTVTSNNNRKRLGMCTLATAIGGAQPNLISWPFVAINDFEGIANDVIRVSKGCYTGFGPILYPEQVHDFEEFVYNYYENTREPEPFPNGTAILPFGKGIWSTGSDGIPVHDVTGNTSWDNTLNILAPMSQHSNGVSSYLMWNMFSSPLFGSIIEAMIQCTHNKVLMGDNPKKCTYVTDIMPNRTSYIQQTDNGPGAVMIQPVFPANNKTEIVGVIATQLVWAENMIDVFSANVDGIDIIFETPTQKWGYTVIQGEVKLVGEGDHHDIKHNNLKIESIITPLNFFGDESIPYLMTLYPNDILYKTYSTNNPAVATVGAICIMLFTVAMFMAYDFLVRREFNSKSELLKAKRHFMRYVSHEVRTPLNSVCMGLNIMKEEIQSKLNNASCKSVGNGDGADTDNTKVMMIVDVKEATSWLHLSNDVHHNAQCAANVLNDFLNYDKIECGQLTLELSLVTITELISSTFNEFILPSQDKDLTFTLNQDEEEDDENDQNDDVECNSSKGNKGKGSSNMLLTEQVVVGDQTRLSQVIRNLLSNAIKFTPKGGSISLHSTWIQATVDELHTFRLHDGNNMSIVQSGWIQIEIIDSGSGMTKEQLRRVFGSGVQFNVNKQQQGGGSGLGLYIAKGIIEQHNGTITVSSGGIGHGCTFVVKLPLFKSPDEFLLSKKKTQTNGGDNTTTPHITTTSNSNRPSSSKFVGDLDSNEPTEKEVSTWLDSEHGYENNEYRILVVDDAPMNRKLLARLLKKRGHHVDMAEDGLQAYEMAMAAMKKDKEQYYDTILMDFQMPVMDGPTSTRKIREGGCDSFIVGITGNVLPEDVAYFQSAGANSVLGKPFQIEKLESLWAEYGVTPRSAVEDCLVYTA